MESKFTARHARSAQVNCGCHCDCLCQPPSDTNPMGTNDSGVDFNAQQYHRCACGCTSCSSEENSATISSGNYNSGQGEI